MTFVPDSIPDPVLVYGNVKLIDAYSGPACTVQKSATSDSSDIAFDGSGNLNISALSTFLTGEPYGRILKWYNQANTTYGNAIKSSDVSIQPPRILPDASYRIAGVPSMLFEGGSHSGEVWGLDIEPPLQPFNISGRNWTVMMVVRPTASIFRNQNRTPDTAQGTFFSLEAAVPFSHSGDTTLGSPVITNVTPIAGIAPGMVVSGPAFPNGDSFITDVLVTGPGVGTVTVFGAGANANFTGVTIAISQPLARMYVDGDGASGSLAVHDGQVTDFKQADFPGLEINPVLLTFRSNFSIGAPEVIGLHSYQNNQVNSSSLVSSRDVPVNTGFIGRWGGSMSVAPPNGGLSKSGDFWCVAVMCWNVTLTEVQMQIMREAFYVRFGLDYVRSQRYSHSITFVGDSIVSGYNASRGLYGMVPRFADMFNSVGSPPVYERLRVMNYSVPGSQITGNVVGSPVYASTEGLFEAGIARNMNYSINGKNVLVILGGGNDAIWSNPPLSCTFVNASPGQAVATPIATDPWTVDQRVVFTLGSGALPAAITAGTFYWVKTVVNPTTINVSATPGGAAINFAGSSGTHTITQYPKTPASIYAGIRRIVDSATLNGCDKVYVCTVLRRTGNTYDFIIDNLNTLIRAGDTVHGFTVIDLEADATLNNNDSPPNVAGPAFPDGTHPNDAGHQAAANALFAAIEPYLYP